MMPTSNSQLGCENRNAVASQQIITRLPLQDIIQNDIESEVKNGSDKSKLEIDTVGPRKRSCRLTKLRKGNCKMELKCCNRIPLYRSLSNMTPNSIIPLNSHQTLMDKVSENSSTEPSTEREKNDRLVNGLCTRSPPPPETVAWCDRTVATIHIPDPSVQELVWHQSPQNVLLVERLEDCETVSDEDICSDCRRSNNNNSNSRADVRCSNRKCISPLERLQDVIIWLIEIKSVTVFMEKESLEKLKASTLPGFENVISNVVAYSEGDLEMEQQIDLIVCVGSDNALLDVSLLFQRSVPPVLAFRLDTHEFLAPLRFTHFKEEFTRAISSESVHVALRSRLVCSIRRSSASETADTSTRNIPEEHLILNEVSIERGSRANRCQLDLHIDKKIVTTVQADGLLIATPTGSTAYAATTGSSMIHPSIPSILVTPICPHSLSFRPIVVPASVEIKVMLSARTRGSVWVSFDGRQRRELCRGDELLIESSCYPVPSICQINQINDWFDTLADCLQWNVRKVQKGLVEK